MIFKCFKFAERLQIDQLNFKHLCFLGDECWQVQTLVRYVSPLEVEGAYLIRPIRLSVCLSVRLLHLDTVKNRKRQDLE